MSHLLQATSASLIVLVAAAAASAAVTPSYSSDLSTFGTPAPATRTYATPDVLSAAAGTRTAEGFTNNRILSQTFRVASNITLDRVALRIGAIAGTGVQGYSLHLYDITGGSSLGGSYRPSTDGPVGPPSLRGVDFFTGSPTFNYTLANSSGNDQLLTLDLTGVDEVALTAGQQYAFELWPVASYSAAELQLIRGNGAASVYPNGDAYQVNDGSPPSNASLRTQLSGASRDAVFAAYAVVPEPATLSAIAGVAFLGAARRRRTA